MSRKKERNQPYIYEFADKYMHKKRKIAKVIKTCDSCKYAKFYNDYWGICTVNWLCNKEVHFSHKCKSYEKKEHKYGGIAI